MIIVKRELLLLGKSFQRIDEILRWDDALFYTVNEKISQWSPAQQLWHIGVVCKLIHNGIETLFRDESPEILRTGGPNLSGRFVLLTGIIPRGRVKAPEAAVPKPEVDRREVIRMIQEGKKAFANTATRASRLHDVKGRMAHFAMGNLNAEQWLRLSQIHTRYHLRIVHRIEQAAKVA